MTTPGTAHKVLWLLLAFFCIGILAGMLIGLLLFGSGGLIPLAAPAAAYPGPTFETECDTPEGNYDGSWCLWTAPNGLRYVVTSDRYRQGPPLYGFR